MFKLSDEQINYIIEFYGGSREIIQNIECELNLIGVIDDENDYFEIVATIVSQKETIKLQLQRCSTKQEIIQLFLANDQIIINELNRRYNNFENESPSKQQKIKNYVDQKIRHN